MERGCTDNLGAGAGDSKRNTESEWRKPGREGELPRDPPGEILPTPPQ